LSKTILVTGSTDGIGLETAKILVNQGHHVLLHGRGPEKLRRVELELSARGSVKSYVADLSDMRAVMSVAGTIKEEHRSIDVLINNAGVLQAPNAVTVDGLDVRFAVNTIAPYLITKALLPIIDANGRIINVSSAAQTPVDFEALTGSSGSLNAMGAYSQSKLAITMWSRALANSLGKNGPVIVAVNPGSMLGSKMVKEKFGVAGRDIRIGADILVRAALSDEFSGASGRYFDNDANRFANPPVDALDIEKCNQLVLKIEEFLRKHFARE